MFRVGFGVDSHAFDDDPKKPLILGGVKVEGHNGLRAHSDGDVILHALFNAVSTALGMRSIGYYFPDNKEENKGKNSWEFLGFLKKEMLLQGFGIENISIMILAKTPKIEPIAEQVKQSIAGYFGVGVDRVGIAATSGEGQDSAGRGESIMVFVSCSITQQK